MWRPRTWAEISALIGRAEETPSVEFKRELGSNNREIAKDIAAMTVDGGVLLYGVEEDKRSRVATATPKVPLAGQEERLRQIAQSTIRPAPSFEVATITEHPGDAAGVIALIVPPSPIAPHEVDGRFPRRNGTIVANLSEPEIERLYQTRRNASGATSFSDTDLLSSADTLPGMEAHRARSVYEGYGLIRIACRPIGGGHHPSGPWLGDALTEAASVAIRQAIVRSWRARSPLRRHCDIPHTSSRRSPFLFTEKARAPATSNTRAPTSGSCFVK